ncbi:MAG: hypothetical protein ACPGVG_16745 [Mycobacterium sp.]
MNPVAAVAEALASLNLGDLGSLRHERVDCAAVLLYLAASTSAPLREVRDALRLPQSTTSDLMARMGDRDLVMGYRRGRDVIYGLTPKGHRIVRSAPAYGAEVPA